MNIKFTGNYAPNEDFGINFQANFDNQNILCVISIEALQDIDPINRQDSPENQYINNQSRFEMIARKKIQNNEINNGRIHITHVDFNDIT